MAIDFIFLNEDDMIKSGVLDMHKCINAMEEMFVLLHKGDYRMGGENANEHGIRVSFPKTSNVKGMPLHKPDYRFMAMPAYLGGRFHMFGIKTYGSNPDNTSKGLPRSVLMMSLMDATTGVPLAYMSANILSAMRTGAVSGLGAKYLCNKNAKTVSIIGPGTMSRYTLKAFIDAVPTLKNVRILGRGQNSINSFIEYCKNEFKSIEEYSVCSSIEDVCKNSDIVFYGTTNAANYDDNPNVKKEWLKKGALVISASALRVETDFLADSDIKLISDNYAMYEGWGAGQPLPTQKNVSTLLGMGFFDAVSEGKIKRSDITDIGEILCKEKSGRTSDDEIVLFSVGGMPIEDVAWGFEVYNNALNNGYGKRLNIWNETKL